MSSVESHDVDAPCEMLVRHDTSRRVCQNVNYRDTVARVVTSCQRRWLKLTFLNMNVVMTYVGLFDF